jgi:hypothetical protein
MSTVNSGLFFPSSNDQNKIIPPKVFKRPLPSGPIPSGPIPISPLPSRPLPIGPLQNRSLPNGSQIPVRRVPQVPIQLRNNLAPQNNLSKPNRPNSPPPQIMKSQNSVPSEKINKLLSNLSELFERFNDINTRINCCNTDIQNFEYRKPQENQKQLTFLGLYTKNIQTFTTLFNAIYNNSIKNYITGLYEIKSQNETQLKSAINDFFNGNKEKFNNIVKTTFNFYISIIDLYINVYINLSRQLIQNDLPYYILDKQATTNKECTTLMVSPFNCFEQIANQGIIRFKLAFNELGKILKEFNLNDSGLVDESSKILDQKIEIAQIVIDYTASQQSIQKIKTLNESDNPIKHQIKKQLDNYYYKKFGNFEIKSDTTNDILLKNQYSSSSDSESDVYSSSQNSINSIDSPDIISTKSPRIPAKINGIFSNLFNKQKPVVVNQLDDLVFTRSP